MAGKANIKTIQLGSSKSFEGIAGIVTRLLFQIQEIKGINRGLSEAAVSAVQHRTILKW